MTVRRISDSIGKAIYINVKLQFKSCKKSEILERSGVPTPRGNGTAGRQFHGLPMKNTKEHSNFVKIASDFMRTLICRFTIYTLCTRDGEL